MSEHNNRFTVLAACGCGHDGRLGLGGSEKDAGGGGNVCCVTPLPFFLPPKGTEAGNADEEEWRNEREVRDVSVGGYHALALTADGGVYGWGANDSGQLGLGRPNSESGGSSGGGGGTPHVRVPTRLDFFDSLRAGQGEHGKHENETVVVAVACGGAHSAVLTTSGLYVCGANDRGQLGLGHDSHPVYTWTLVPGTRGAPGAGEPLPGDKGVWLRGAGEGNTDESESAAVKNNCRVTHVSCGTSHTLIACRGVLLAAGTEQGQEGAEEEQQQQQQQKGPVWLPAAVLACGGGTFGELGYDADPWAAARSKAERVQRQWAAHATILQQQQQQHGGATGAAPQLHGADGGGPDTTAMTHPDQVASAAAKFGWKGKKKRREEFYSTSFGIVPIPELQAQAQAAAVEGLEDAETSRWLQQGAAEGLWRVAGVQAMHLHSAVTLERSQGDEGEQEGARTQEKRQQQQQQRLLYHWGCYYCGEVEGDESSVPRRDDLPPPEDTSSGGNNCGGSPYALLAGDEILMCVTTTAATAAATTTTAGFSPHEGEEAKEEGEVAVDASRAETESAVWVRGSGVLGLGDEDSFERDWVRLPGVSGVRQLAGRSHLLLLGQESGGGEDGGSVAAGGDKSESPAPPHGPRQVVWGFGDNLHGQLASDSTDAALSPAVVLRAGDVVGGGYRVLGIRSVHAGARHSVLLLEVCRE